MATKSRKRKVDERVDGESTGDTELGGVAGAKEAPRGAWPDGVRAVVVGGANNWADDFAKIPEGWATVVVAVNDVGTVLPEIDH